MNKDGKLCSTQMIIVGGGGQGGLFILDSYLLKTFWGVSLD